MATFRCSLVTLMIASGLLVHLGAHAQNMVSERQTDPQHWEYIAHLRTANAYLNANQISAARSYLERCPEPRRAWEWAYLNRRLNPMLGVFPGSEDCNSVAFSSDGTMLYGCDGEGPLRVWDVASLTELPPIEGPQLNGRPARALAVSPRGTFVLFAPAKFKPPPSVKIVLRGSDLEERMTSMADVERLRPKSATVAVVRIDTEEVVSFLGSTGGRVEYVEFSEDERRVMLAGNPPMMCYCWGSRVADVLTGETLYQGTYGADQGARPAMSPDGRLLAEPNHPFRIDIVDVDSGEVIHTLATTDEDRSKHPGGNMRSVSFISGSPVLVGTCERGDLYAWDVDSGSLVTAKRRSGDSRRRNPNALSELFRTPQSVLATCDDGAVREIRWNATTGTPRIREMSGFEPYISGVASHAASNRLATCASKEIRLWSRDRDISTFVPLPDAKRGLDVSDHTLLCHGVGTRHVVDVATHHVTRIEMSREEAAKRARSSNLEDLTRRVGTSPNGRYEVLSTDVFTDKGRVRSSVLMDRTTEEIKLRWTESSDVYHRENAEFIDDDTLVFQPLPDDQFTAPISDEYATLVVFDPGCDVIRCQIPDAPRTRVAAVVAPDQDHLVLHANGSLHMWNLMTGERVRSFGSHAGGLRQFYFLPDGSRVLTTGRDGTIHVWDPETGDLVLVLEDLPASAHALSVIGDGRQIALNRSWIMDTRPVAEFVQARESWASGMNVVAAPAATSR